MSIYSGISEIEFTATPKILAGTIDPSAGGGLAAAEGTFYMRFVAGAGTVWYKAAAADTAWLQLPSLGSTNSFVGDQGSDAVDLVDAAIIATNCPDGNFFRVSLAADRILGAPAAPKAGHTYLWQFTSVGAGRVITFNAVFLFPGGTAFVTGSGGAGSIDSIATVYNGANFLVLGGQQDIR